MTETEKEKLRNLNRSIPKMTPEKRMEFLAFTEGMAFMMSRQEEEKSGRQVAELAAAGGRRHEEA